MTGSDEFSEPDDENICTKHLNSSDIIQLDGNASVSLLSDDHDNTNKQEPA